tara:strand:- start:294 stop:494 length:201 start_codon:yes stop_codon:yes gene_type:complete
MLPTNDSMNENDFDMNDFTDFNRFTKLVTENPSEVMRRLGPYSSLIRGATEPSLQPLKIIGGFTNQ